MSCNSLVSASSKKESSELIPFPSCINGGMENPTRIVFTLREDQRWTTLEGVRVPASL